MLIAFCGDLVHSIMLQEDEEGFEKRSKASQRRQIKRYKMYSAGPGDHLHSDGNEKFRMFPIYIFKDRATSLVTWADARPNIRKKNHVHLMFLENMEAQNGQQASLIIDSA